MTMKIKDIDTTTIEGRTLIKAIGYIGTIGDNTNKTPDEILKKLISLDKIVPKDLSHPS